MPEARRANFSVRSLASATYCVPIVLDTRGHLEPPAQLSHCAVESAGGLASSGVQNLKSVSLGGYQHVRKALLFLEALQAIPSCLFQLLTSPETPWLLAVSF